MPASNFIVAVILEAREGAELRVQRGRCISPFGEDSNGLVDGVAVVDAQVEQKRGVKCVPLRMQGVASVFHEHQAVCIPERDVVEPRVRHIAAVEKRQHAAIARQVQTEERAKSSEFRTGLGKSVCVTRGIENKLREIRSWPKLSVFRTLEGSATSGFCRSIRIKRCSALCGSIVNCHPRRLELQSVGVEVSRVLRGDISISVG